jgi:hypothetical protein
MYLFFISEKLVGRGEGDCLGIEEGKHGAGKKQSVQILNTTESAPTKGCV